MIFYETKQLLDRKSKFSFISTVKLGQDSKKLSVLFTMLLLSKIRIVIPQEVKNIK